MSDAPLPDTSAPPTRIPDRHRTLVVRIVAAVLGLAALAGIAFCWFFAGLSLCGISGCGGGGFGPSYGGPHEVFPFLAASGLCAMVPFLLLGARRGHRIWWVAGGLVLVLVPFLGLFLIGSGLDGYPRSVPHEFGQPPPR